MLATVLFRIAPSSPRGLDMPSCRAVILAKRQMPTKSRARLFRTRPSTGFAGEFRSPGRPIWGMDAEELRHRPGQKRPEKRRYSFSGPRASNQVYNPVGQSLVAEDDVQLAGAGNLLKD